MNRIPSTLSSRAMVEALPAVHVNRRDSLLDYPFSKLSDSTLEPLDSFQHTLLDIFNSIGALGLRRSNRQDLSALSDGSIHEARDSINDLIQILLPPPQQELSSVNQFQRSAARITKNYYARNPGQEAFCNEHAELVLDGMSHAGIADGALLLKICDKSDTNRSHVLVIHAGGPADDASKLLKPFVEQQRVAPLTYRPPGMNLDTFANHIADNADKIHLIDAWGTDKRLDFPGGSSPSEVKSVLSPMIREGLGWDPDTVLENKDFHIVSPLHVSELRRVPEYVARTRDYIRYLASPEYSAPDIFETIFNEIGAYKFINGADRLILAGHLTRACRDNGIVNDTNMKTYLQNGNIYISESGRTGRSTFIPLANANRPFE